MPLVVMSVGFCPLGYSEPSYRLVSRGSYHYFRRRMFNATLNVIHSLSCVSHTCFAKSRLKNYSKGSLPTFSRFFGVFHHFIFFSNFIFFFISTVLHFLHCFSLGEFFLRLFCHLRLLLVVAASRTSSNKVFLVYLIFIVHILNFCHCFVLWWHSQPCLGVVSPLVCFHA